MFDEKFESYNSFGSLGNKGVEGFFMPRALLQEDELCTTEKLVLCEIIGISNGKDDCSINNDDIAEMLRLSSKTIANTITSLIKKMYIEIKIEFAPGTQKQVRRIIVLTFKLKNLFSNKKIQEIEIIEKDQKNGKNEIVEEAKIENPENRRFNAHGNPENGNISENRNPEVRNDNPQIGNLSKNEAPDLGSSTSIYTNNTSLNKESSKDSDKEISKEENNNKNTNTKTSVSPSVSLDIFNVLGEPQCLKLNKNTKRNIIKNFSHLKGEDFKRIFNQMIIEEQQGFVHEFDAAFYLALKGQWRYRAVENDGPKMECAEEKIRWFKSCFRGIKVEEYLELLAKIPYDILLKNRQRLGKLSPFEFRTEFRKLSFIEKK